MKTKLVISNKQSDINCYRLYNVTYSYLINTLFIIFTLILLLTCIARAETINSDLENTRAIIEKWVETRRIISQEKHDFQLAKEMLSERIELVKREISTLRGKIDETKKNITDADQKRGELLEENDKLKDASLSLNSTINKLESETKKLLKRLPDPIKERVKPLSQRIPEKPDETKLSLGERFQNVVGVLNEVNKFNREITLTSEVRDLPDGTSTEVTALYIGIGQGYYVNGSGTVAGIGTSSPDGWVWSPANDAGEEISKAIAILKNEAPASFVKLPLEIK